MADAPELDEVLSPEIRSALLARSHVRDVGIGFKSVGGRLTDTPAIIIYVDRKLPLTALSSADLIPPAIAGVPTDVELDLDARYLRPADEVPADSTRVRPLQSGISIGINSDHAGTLGFFARRNSDNKPVLVSNYHVLFRGRGLPGLDSGAHPVLQPPIGTENRIGEVAGGKIGGPIDAAFAVLDEEGACCCTCVIPYKNGTADLAFKGVAKAKQGDIVSKTGRTTGRTFGKVVNANKKIDGPVDYSAYNLPDGDQFDFHSLIMIVKWDPVAATFVPEEPFGDHGDSGAALVNANGEIVGLHFMSYTSPSGDRHYSFGSHIETVETLLGIKVPGTRTGLVGGPDVPDPAIAMLDNPIDTSTGTVMIGGQSFPAASVRAVGDRLDAAFAAASAGAAWRAVFERHHYEVLRHVNHSIGVTIAWHRAKGPAWLAALIRSVNRPAYMLPAEVDGVGLETLATAMGAALLEAGSVELKAEIMRQAALVAAVAGDARSTLDFVERLCATPPIGPEPQSEGG